MSRSTRRARAWATGVAAVATIALAPGGTAQAAPAKNGCANRANNTPDKLLECVRLEGVRAHQAALQRIADANDGNRFSGFPGYDASVDYVVDTLEDAGYEPEVQEFDYLAFETVGASTACARTRRRCSGSPTPTAATASPATPATTRPSTTSSIS